MATSATTLRKIDCIMLKVDDLDAAREFYIRVFGMHPTWRDATSVGLRFPESDAEIVLHRIGDIPMRVDETIALAALIQATVAKLYRLYAANQGFRLYRRSLLMENKWRAARYGMDGKLIDFGKQLEVPERELIEEYLEFVDDVLDELDCREEVEYVREIVKMGTGADRQLRVFRETGDMKAVVDYIIEETEVGVDEVNSLPAAKAV